MNWVKRKIYLYNITFGLYMLDWWEQYLFHGLVLQRHTLLFRTIQEPFYMKTGCTVEHEKPGTSKGNCLTPVI
ncbi:hypothetical protein HID58_061271 [Brassica napus]|uniref:Uncharacterized protein n=1 Tax=Brassica napus TaxID=3708 RepID=A0ABQ7ZZ80_BRANA|nr:hypothetical protein HID58_061271 [Brassica napus]